MEMSGINQEIVYSINRLRATFVDDLGNTEKGTGTGFWVKVKDGRPVFVTNKHNVDPALLFGGETAFQLSELQLEVRRREGNQPKDETQFFSVANISEAALVHDDADCAIVVDPCFEAAAEEFTPTPYIPEHYLADSDWISANVAIMDLTSFLGFPGAKGTPWWDTERNLPIARLATIASVPREPFQNRDIKTSNVTLVSGMSFSGSSGSPVMRHAVGNVLLAPAVPYVGSKLIGIMSGHLRRESDLPEMFRHTGLSYFTRSDSILELIERALCADRLPR